MTPAIKLQVAGSGTADACGVKKTVDAEVNDAPWGSSKVIFEVWLKSQAPPLSQLSLIWFNRSTKGVAPVTAITP
jgi:hypothetical protein